jgi:hypothetical protein
MSAIYRDLNRGLKAGYGTANKFGYNKDLDTGANGETVRPSGGLFTPVTSAQTLNAVSSSAADDTGGTGCSYLRIIGLDADYNELTEDIFLDGTNAVTTTNSFIALNRAVGIFFGSSQNNVGNITITQTTSGTEMGYIIATACITQQLIYTVPLNQEAQLDLLELDALKISGGGSPRVRFLLKSYVPDSNGIYITIDQTIDTSITNKYILNPPYSSEVEHKTTIWIDAITDGNNTEVTGRFYYNLYPRNTQ